MPAPLDQQTVVITGASSGIGRAAALLFGRRRASVVLAARNEAALRDVAQGVADGGGVALVVPTDVGRPAEVERLAERAAERFGGIDTWVNNAGVSAYARFEDLTAEEIERIVRVDLLGALHGARVALPRLRERGGTLINVASVVGVQPLPFQAPYCAAKAALIAFGQSLRAELAQEDGEVHVTTILPPSTNTPFFEHALSKLGRQAKPVPPVWQPNVVAESIVFAAAHPRREIAVGAAGRQLTLLGRLAPGLGERLFSLPAVGREQQLTDEPDDGRHALFEPGLRPATEGEFGRFALPVSPYTKLFEHYPVTRPLAALGTVARAVSGRR